MKISLFKHQDFVTGLLFGLIGLFTIVVASSYTIGSAKSMGPGYFPLVLGLILLLLGLFIAVRSQFSTPDGASFRRFGRIALRPVLLILGSMLLFALALTHLGFALSSFGLVVVSGLAYHQYRWLEVGWLGCALSLFAVIVFVQGLGLPFQVLPN